MDKTAALLARLARRLRRRADYHAAIKRGANDDSAANLLRAQADSLEDLAAEVVCERQEKFDFQTA